MEENQIQEFGEYGNYINIKSHIDTVEYEVEGNIYTDSSSSWIEIVMCDYMNDELGSVKLSNSDAIYLAQLILKNVVLIND